MQVPFILFIFYVTTSTVQLFFRKLKLKLKKKTDYRFILMKQLSILVALVLLDLCTAGATPVSPSSNSTQLHRQLYKPGLTRKYLLKRNETQLRPTTTIKPTITVSPLFSRRKVLRKKLLSSTNVTSNGLALSPLSVLISNTDSDLLTQTTFNNTLTATDVQQPVTDPTTLPILVQPSSGFVLADSAVLPSNPIVVSRKNYSFLLQYNLQNEGLR